MGKKWLISKYIMTMQPIGFVIDGLMRKGELRITQKSFSLSNMEKQIFLRYRKSGLMEGGRLEIRRPGHLGREFESLLDIKRKCQRPLEMSL